jgi:hypothetical protein
LSLEKRGGQMLREYTHKELVEIAESIEENPRYASFKAALIQIKFWDAEIAANPISIRDNTEEDTRLFDKVLKYQAERQKLLNSLDIDRNLLLPEDVKNVEQESTSLVDDIRKRVKDEIRQSADN